MFWESESIIFSYFAKIFHSVWWKLVLRRITKLWELVYWISIFPSTSASAAKPRNLMCGLIWYFWSECSRFSRGNQDPLSWLVYWGLRILCDLIWYFWSECSSISKGNQDPLGWLVIGTKLSAWALNSDWKDKFVCGAFCKALCCQH